jgi:NAD(P)-dependent dehydrogenase (short-subunit alcohol dehydrogenase family)
MKIDLTGKIALITGGTRGIGREIAGEFLSLGAKVIVTGTKKPANDKLFAPSNDVTFLKADFSKKDSFDKFLGNIKKMGRIDICVNNAGINRIDLINETKKKDWEDITKVNLQGPFFITRAISGKMKKNKYGRIINISSIFGKVSKEKRSIYSITKFGLHGLTVSVSNELAKYNVLVNTVSPGFVLTDLTKKILSKKEIAELSKQVPIGRFASPGEISKIVVFLASEYNTYLTGKNIVVDGGFIDV